MTLSLTSEQIEAREMEAYGEIEAERHRQRPKRGQYAYLRHDGTIGFAACFHIKNYAASLNAVTDERFILQQLPSDGFCWLEGIGEH